MEANEISINEINIIDKPVKRNFFIDNIYIILAFIVSMGIMTGIYIATKIYPFGDLTVAIMDMVNTFYSFYCELHHKLLNGGSLLYNWNGEAGQNFLVMSTAGATNPMNYLIVLFPEEYILEFLAFMIALKISLSSAAFSYYLKKVSDKNNVMIMAFGLLYGFCMFTIAMRSILSFLDVGYLVPLVMLGLQKLVREGKFKLYAVSLALLIWSSFAIAFQVCILLVVYFFGLLYLESRRKLMSNKERDKLVLDRCVRFFFFSFLAGMSAMPIGIPLIFARELAPISNDVMPSSLVFYNNPLEFLSRHLFGTYPIAIAGTGALPNVYSGVICLILTPIYFLNKKFARKEKIVFGIMVGILYLLYNVNTFDFVINLMHFTNGMHYRSTYVYTFFVLALAYKAFTNLDGIRLRPLIIVYAVAACVLAGTVLISWDGSTGANWSFEAFLGRQDMIINAGLIAGYIIGITLIKYKKLKRTLTVLLSLVIVAEAAYGGYLGFLRTGAISREAIMYNYEGMNEIVSYLNEKGDSKNNFYRTEIARNMTINDASMYHYKGISSFNAAFNSRTQELMGRLGLISSTNIYRYAQTLPFFDTMFGIKYLVSKDNPLKDERYDLINTVGPLMVYEYPYALPLGYMVSNEVVDWDISKQNPFMVQNDFVNKAVGLQEQLYNAAKVVGVEYNNITVVQDPASLIYVYTVEDEADLENMPSVRVVYQNEYEPKWCYVYVLAPVAGSGATIGSRNDFYVRDVGRGEIFHPGKIETDDVYNIEFPITEKDSKDRSKYAKTSGYYLFAGSLNEDVQMSAYEELNDEPLEIEEYRDTYIKGTVHAKKDGILFTTIPYDAGWSAKVDGKKAEIVPIANKALIGVRMPEGEHQVELSFMPKGLIPGLVIAALSVMAFVGTSILIKKGFLQHLLQ